MAGDMTDSTRRMFRYQVPVDDAWHTFTLTHNPVAVAVATLDVVEFWAEHDPSALPFSRSFRVFGTGHALPPGAAWRGTCPRAAGLVWHLYETEEA